MTDQWKYTNESEAKHVITARIDRWYVEVDNGEASIWHNDMPPMSLARIDTSSHEADRVSGTGSIPLTMLRDFLTWHAAQPEPIKPGDYVRLVGDRWGGEHQPDAGTCHEVKGIYPNDGQPYFDWGTARMFTHPGEYERITVTADLDEPWNLPLPEVGEHVWVKYLDGIIRHGEVTRAGAVELIFGGSRALFAKQRVAPSGANIAAWGTYDPADLAPDEPTTFGYVGYVTDEVGEHYDILRGRGNRPDFHHVIRREDGCHYGQRSWPDVLALGTFTAVER